MYLPYQTFVFISKYFKIEFWWFWKIFLTSMWIPCIGIPTIYTGSVLARPSWGWTRSMTVVLHIIYPWMLLESTFWSFLKQIPGIKCIYLSSYTSPEITMSMYFVLAKSSQFSILLQYLHTLWISFLNLFGISMFVILVIITRRNRIRFPFFSVLLIFAKWRFFNSRKSSFSQNTSCYNVLPPLCTSKSRFTKTGRTFFCSRTTNY